MDEEKVNQLLNINNEIIFNGNNKDALSKLVFSIEESNDETKNVLASNKVQIDYDSFKNGDETFTKPDMSSVKNYIVLPKEVIIDENGEEQIQETITQNSAGTEVAISPETTQVAADGVGTEETPANIDLSNAENIKEFNLSSAVVNIKNTSDESITIPEFNASDGTQANVESDLISENIKLKSGAKLKVNGNLNAEKEVKVDGGTMKTEGSITTPDLNATNGGAVEAKQIKSEKVTADNSNITTETLEAEDVDIKKVGILILDK